MIGYDYFQSCGMPWRRIHQAVVPLAMPHVDPELNTWQAMKVLLKGRGLVLRWAEEFDRPAEGEWWHLIKDPPEDLSELKPNVRNQVRRGLKRFKIDTCSREYVLEHGHAVYRKAYERYETFEPVLQLEEFQEAVRALPPETEFWAAHDEAGNFVAFSENLVRDQACFYLTMWFEPMALKRYVSYAMIHEMNKHYLNQKGCKYVSDGARSISHDTNVHEFLRTRFGFRRAYANLRVAYFPGLHALVAALYPLRRRLAGWNRPWARKLEVLMEIERIRRACRDAVKRS